MQNYGHCGYLVVNTSVTFTYDIPSFIQFKVIIVWGLFPGDTLIELYNIANPNLPFTNFFLSNS